MSYFSRKAKLSKDLLVKDYPNNTQILWNKGIAKLSNHYDFSTPVLHSSYQNIKENDIVWVRVQNLDYFTKIILSKIKNKFTLITGDSVLSVPYEIENNVIKKILENNYLRVWFAQNLYFGDQVYPQIKPIPLGIDFHSQYEKKNWRFKSFKTPLEQEEELNDIRQSFNHSKKNRKLKILSDFHFSNSSKELVSRLPSEVKKDRKMIYRSIKKNPCYDFLWRRLKRHRLWEKMVQYQFIISPHGKGLDCHRTWEALALGCYVVVEKSSLDSLYEKLPVVIVDDFSKITKSDLEKWQKHLQARYPIDILSERLTNQYWINQVLNHSS